MTLIFHKQYKTALTNALRVYNSFQLSALHAFQVSLLDAEHSVKNEEEGNSLLL